MTLNMILSWILKQWGSVKSIIFLKLEKEFSGTPRTLTWTPDPRPTVVDCYVSSPRHPLPDKDILLKMEPLSLFLSKSEYIVGWHIGKNLSISLLIVKNQG